MSNWWNECTEAVRAKDVNAASVAALMNVPGKAWSGNGVRTHIYSLDKAPVVQVRGKVLANYGKIFSKYPKGKDGTTNLWLYPRSAEVVAAMDHELRARIVEVDAGAGGYTWKGINVERVLTSVVDFENEQPLVAVFEGEPADIKNGDVCDIHMRLHRIVVNHTSSVITPKWRLMALRKCPDTEDNNNS